MIFRANCHSYGCEAELLLGETIILSKTGFHQGDPLAPLLFSLTLQPIVNKIKEKVPSLSANEWYLDDGALAGKVEELRTVIDIIQTHGPQRGLYLSAPKTTVWCPSSLTADQLDQLDPLGRGISLVKEPGIVLLGSPIGSIAFQRQANMLRIQKI